MANAFEGLGYATFGLSEGLRRSQNLRAEMIKMKMAQTQAQQDLALRRYAAETDAIMGADKLRMEWKRLNSEKARATASLEFERDKLNEQKRQFELELPIKQKQAESLEKYREVTGEAAQTRAAAARTAAVARAKAAGSPMTPQGMIAQFVKAKNKGLEQYVKDHELTWIQVMKDPKRRREAEQFATEYAHNSIAEAMSIYQDLAEFGVVTPMAVEDVEAVVEETKPEAGFTGEKVQEELDTFFDRIVSDPKAAEDFRSRITTGKLTKDEEAALEYQANTKGGQWAERLKLYRQTKNTTVDESLNNLFTVTPEMLNKIKKIDVKR